MRTGIYRNMTKPLIIWDEDNFAIGIESIDLQHKTLVSNINELHFAIESNNVNKMLVQHLFDKLYDYTIYHFKEEENYLNHLNEQDYKLHILQHKHFIEELDRLKCSGNELDISADLLYFLTDWLMHHIVSEDKKLNPPTKETPYISFNTAQVLNKKYAT